jgi:chaperonin GroEL
MEILKGLMSGEQKELAFSNEAREKLLRGAQTVANQVAFSLGANKTNEHLSRRVGETKLTDRFEKIGAEIAKEAMNQVEALCGDGTTTTALLLATIVDQALKCMITGAKPAELKRGIELGVAHVIASLERHAKKIVEPHTICMIANTTTCGQSKIGTHIAEAYKLVGLDGQISIEQTSDQETKIEIIEGVKFDQGYASPYFVTDSEQMAVEFINAKVLIVNRKISSPYELLPILREMIGSSSSLLIIADEFAGDTLSTLEMNKIRDLVRVAAVRSPQEKQAKNKLLDRIVSVTGAKVVLEEDDLADLSSRIDLLGSADLIRVTKESTMILRLDQGNSKKIEARVPSSEKIALIRLGEKSSRESKGLKEQYQKTLLAVHGAIRTGYIAGGGLALFRCGIEIENEYNPSNLSHDELLGIQIVKKACEVPIMQLIRNSGSDPKVVLDQIRQGTRDNGWNIENCSVEDLIQAGVMDPVNTVRTAIKTAAETAGAMILTDAVVGKTTYTISEN